MDENENTEDETASAVEPSAALTATALVAAGALLGAGGYKIARAVKPLINARRRGLRASTAGETETDIVDIDS